MKRLNSILSLDVNPPNHIYDLYTDHGKIGLAFSKKFKEAFLTFIDIRSHLINDLENKYSFNQLYSFKTQDANLTKFKNKSLVLMCGVGGNLIISCLESYLKQENIHTHEFIICATMHTLELRKFLQDNDFIQKDFKVADENGRCYEVLLVSYSGQASNIKIFAANEWSFSHPIHKRYLKSKIKSLEDKHQKKSWEKNILLEIKNFINGN